MNVRPDEIVGRIFFPRGRAGWKSYYRKVGTRRAQAISKVCFAAAVHFDGATVNDIRIALGSVAPTVMRATQTETASAASVSIRHNRGCARHFRRRNRAN